MISRLYFLMLSACLIGLPAAGSTVADEVQEEEDSAKRCIYARKLKSTVVIDDSNVLFFMVGKTVYRNQLPKQCKGLFEHKTFVYARVAGRICEFNRIEVHSSTGPLARNCRLGSFQPIRQDEIRPLIEALHATPKANPLPAAEVEDVSVTDEPKDETPN